MNAQSLLFEDERTWSPYQLAIFADAANGTGNTTILARAGTGKTTTLVETVRRTPAGKRTLVLAFNTSIKAELERKMPEEATVRTLHGLGLAAIKQAFPRSRTEPGRLRSILKRAHTEATRDGKGGVEGFYPRPEQARRRGAVDRLVRFAKATMIEPLGPLGDIAHLCLRAGVNPVVEFSNREDTDDHNADVLALAQGRAAQAVARVLETCIAEVGQGHDYDDMLYLPHVLRLGLATWDRVVVDEAQDLSAVQMALLVRTVAPGGRVLVVGDDRQAIYGFRGADSSAFALLTERLGAKVLPLTVTYRCPRAVVRLARTMVPDFESGPGASEGHIHEVEGIKAADLAPGDFVLSRTNAPLLRLFFQCIAAGVPAVLQGREGFLGDLISALTEAEEQAGPSSDPSRVRELAMEPFTRALAKRAKNDEDPGDLADQRDCMVSLFDRYETARRVRDQLERLARADGKEASKAERAVCLSSVHRAKGLERNKVWMLADTFRKDRSREEGNLWYVAVTRAKRELVMVKGVK